MGVPTLQKVKRSFSSVRRDTLIKAGDTVSYLNVEQLGSADSCSCFVDDFFSLFVD